MNCRICDAEYTDNIWVVKDDPTVCDRCHMMLYGRYGRCGHGLSGMSDGPTSMSNETNFNTPNVYKETLKAAKAMEDAGRLTPKAEQTFRRILDKAEPHKNDKVDYQKTGHPLARS